jgi:uncharacterized protein DUF3352
MRHTIGFRRLVSRPAALVAALLATAAIAVAGCGGGASATGAKPARAADFVPAGAPMYFEVSTNGDSPQWAQVVALGKKFPGWDQLTSELNAGLHKKGLDFETDIKPLLGDHAAVSITSLPRMGGAAAAERPGILAVAELAAGKDAAAQQRLASAATGAPGQHAGVAVYRLGADHFAAVDDGALLAADSQAGVESAIDAHAAGGSGTLGGTGKFTDALRSLPPDVFALGYIDAGAIAKSAPSAGPGGMAIPSLSGLPNLQNAAVALSLSAEGGGVRMKGILSGAENVGAAKAFTPALTSHVPGDAVAYLGANDVGSVVMQVLDSLSQASPDAKRQIDALTAQIPGALGVSLDDLKALLGGEHALVVTAGEGGPAVSAVLQTADGARTTKTLDTLREKVPALVAMLKPGTTLPAWKQVDLGGGLSGWQLPLSPKAGVVYGVDGNLALLGTTPDAVRAVRDPVSPLSQNADYVDATRAMPDQVTSVLWVDVQRAVNLLDAQGAFAGKQKLLDNLRPLKSLAAWSTGGDQPTFEAFLAIR